MKHCSNSRLLLRQLNIANKGYIFYAEYTIYAA
jgi:hypothetical protein